MKCIIIKLLFAALVLVALFATTLRAAPPSKPNIVLIVADDLGYGDVSCQGAKLLTTPHIDRLAKQGMRFTDAHSPASVCSPSRYGILTGRYPWRLHLTGNDYHLEPGRLTMASMLQAQGYACAAIGKWHLGYSKDWNQPPITGPLEVGFTRHFGVPMNHNDSYRVFIDDRDIHERIPGVKYEYSKTGLPKGIAKPRVDDLVDQTLTDKAVEFIRGHATQPFFLYFTPCAPHTHVAPQESFRGSSRCGLLGDYIQELDAHVGRLLALLDELKLTTNTLVVFTSDNGSTPKDFQSRYPADLNLASEAGDLPAKSPTAKADAKKLGHVTNGPWHDGKASPHEGGHRVPLIVRWPGQIAEGKQSDHTLCLTDLFATIAEITSYPLPHDAAEDSITFLSTLLQKNDAATAGPSQRFIQGDQNDRAIAIRSGKWKLIASKNNRGGTNHQLFDLSVDQGETEDVRKLHPDVVETLSSALKTAAEEGRTRPVR